jgi:carbon-monoxide dehydrogenase medium subunit
MFPASFGYVAARSVEDALDLMAKHGEDGKLLAGGHSLIPAMKLRLQSPRTLIDLGTVAGLRGIRLAGALLMPIREPIFRSFSPRSTPPSSCSRWPALA